MSMSEGRLKWNRADYDGHTLNYWFCKASNEGKTLEERVQILSELTGRSPTSIKGACRLVDIRHSWLVNGWGEGPRSVYKIAKLAYTLEFIEQGGQIHSGLRGVMIRWWGHIDDAHTSDEDSS
jgi:hypothetical protein